jgi:hypothetical protein
MKHYMIKKNSGDNYEKEERKKIYIEIERMSK